MHDFEFPDDEIATAVAHERKSRSLRPEPSAARYDAASGRIVVEFANGAAFMVPARSLQGLEAATDADLSEVELLGDEGLHWETLDADFTIAGLMAGIFGTARFMDELRRKGGGSRSAAKSAAARQNGLKGGRPRKTG